MSNDVQRYNASAMVSNNDYRRSVSVVATRALTEALGEEEGKRKAVRFTLAFQAAAQSNPALLNLPPDAVGIALAKCLLADLLPGGMSPQVWLLPKRIKGAPTLQVWIAPHGLRELARRADTFVQEIPVWRGEEAEASDGAERVAEGRAYVPRPSEKAHHLKDLIGFYIVVRDRTGSRVEWLSSEEIDKRRKNSDTDAVWSRWGYEMARKTAIKYVFNRGLVGTDRAATIALSMETEQEVPRRPPAPSQQEAAAAMGLPDVVEAEDLNMSPLDHARADLASWAVEDPREFSAVCGGVDPNTASLDQCNALLADRGR